MLVLLYSDCCFICREKESSSSKNHLVTIKSLSFENETAQKKIATSKKELAEVNMKCISNLFFAFLDT